MRSLCILLMVLLLRSLPLFSQCTLSGTIRGVDKQGVMFATVVAVPENSTEIIAFCTSDVEGNYSLSIAKSGNYTLSFSALSFQKVSIQVGIHPEDTLIRRDVILPSQPLELQEVVVAADRPISFKKDTIVFNAASFRQGDEQVVEDLLRKLPGLSVSGDGRITVGNKEVEKVMIEGDDFFEKGYRMVTKNMPVSPVSKIEILSHYSANKLLKEIEQSDKVALNIRLDEKSKGHWFGNLLLGYGGNKLYDVRTNWMNFSKQNKVYLLANANSVGYTYTDYIDHLINPYSAEDEAVAEGDESAGALLSLEGHSPDLEGKRVNFNRSGLLSANAIVTLSPQLKLRTIGLLNREENDFNRYGELKYSTEAGSFTTTDALNLNTRALSGVGKVDLNYEISGKQSLAFSGQFNAGTTDNRSDRVFNADSLEEDLTGRRKRSDAHLVYSHRFAERKVFILAATYTNDLIPQQYSASRFLFSDFFPVGGDAVAQSSTTRMQSLAVEGLLMNRRANGNLLELRVGAHMRNDSIRSRFEINEGNTTVDAPFSNQVRYLTNDLYAKVNYLLQFKRLSLAPAIGIHQLFTTLSTPDNIISSRPFLLHPSLSIIWELNNKHRISTSYAYTVRMNTVDELYSNYLLTDLYTLSRGTGAINQFAQSSSSLMYTYGSWGDRLFATAFVLYNRDHDYLSTNTHLTRDYLLSEQIALKGRNYLLVSTSINRYFKFIRSNFKLSVDLSKSGYQSQLSFADTGYTAGDHYTRTLQTTRTESMNYGAELRSGFSGLFNYHLGYSSGIHHTRTTGLASYTRNKIFVDLTFNIHKRFLLISKTERYDFRHSTQPGTSYLFSDLEARYTVIDNKLTLSLTGHNLFNTQSFVNYSMNDRSSSTTLYTLRPRMLLVKAEYRF
jgi:hypothetical protein